MGVGCQNEPALWQRGGGRPGGAPAITTEAGPPIQPQRRPRLSTPVGGAGSSGRRLGERAGGCRGRRCRWVEPGAAASMWRGRGLRAGWRCRWVTPGCCWCCHRWPPKNWGPLCAFSPALATEQSGRCQHQHAGRAGSGVKHFLGISRFGNQDGSWQQAGGCQGATRRAAGAVLSSSTLAVRTLPRPPCT